MMTSTKQYYDIISQGNFANDKSTINNPNNEQNIAIDEIYPSKTPIAKNTAKKRQKE